MTLTESVIWTTDGSPNGLDLGVLLFFVLFIKCHIQYMTSVARYLIFRRVFLSKEAL
jgi:hypothetical protein